MLVLNVGHFAGSGVGIVPKRHVDSVCGRALKRPTGFAALLTRQSYTGETNCRACALPSY
jgi:hypothetical protein